MTSQTVKNKAKGRRFQQQIAEKLRKGFGISEKDLYSNIISAPGEDIFSSLAIQDKIPLSIKCKVRADAFGTIYNYFEQTKVRAPKNLIPTLFIKKLRSKPLVVLDADDFISLLKGNL